MGRGLAALALLGSLMLAACVQAQGSCGGGSWLESPFTVPSGFRVQLYWDGKVKFARSLAVSGKKSTKGPVIVYVSAIKFFPPAEAQIITALVDETNRGGADYAVPLTDAATFEGATMPNGIAWYKGALYVAVLKGDQWCRLYRINGADALALAKKARTATAADVELLRDDLPIDFLHGWKFIRFDKKGNLIIPIGANTNVAFMNGEGVVSTPQWQTLDAQVPGMNKTSQLYQKGPDYPKYRFASIYRIKPPYTGGLPGKKGDPPEMLAEGVRNTVGFDLHPKYGLYFNDNGRDNFGGANQAITDNSPDCEFNYFGSTTGKVAAPRHFGFPYCHTGSVGGQDATPFTRALGVGAALPDPDTNVGEANMKCGGGELAYTPAVQAVGPHVAPLGLRFYSCKGKCNFPKEYKDVAFIATHGSWNRNKETAGAIGARIMMLKLKDQTTAASFESFMAGGLPRDKGEPNGPNPKPLANGTWIARPVDVDVLPDGSVIVSDDFAGRVYRIVNCASATAPGAGRCAGAARPQVEKASSKKVDKAAAACGVRVSDEAGAVPVLYSRCARSDLTGRKNWATVAWTWKSVPGDATKVRLSTAVVMDDFASVVGAGWLAHGLPPASSSRAAMSGANVVMSKQQGSAAASITDLQLGEPGGDCHSVSCFTSTKEGTFYDKSSTLRASMAGGALVQRAEFLVAKETLKGWKNAALVMLALGNTDPSTGQMLQHWAVPSFKLPFEEEEVDAAIPPTDKVANPKPVDAALGGGGAPPPPPLPQAANCSWGGAPYNYCGGVTASHYYNVTGGRVTAVVRARMTGSRWLGWLYNAGAPGTMIGENAHAAIALGGASSLATAQTLKSTLPSAWTASSFYQDLAASVEPDNEHVLAFSFAFPAGAASIMVNNGYGSWTGSNGHLGMAQHSFNPVKICLRASGELAPLNSCGTCD
ncbi:MAG: hypothetical protein J3K34DRAFT_526235 [Monoraphidium minutum]|nr:MAG: hypothetical protein J3K34DRAFT_526235 [Monoraphidium minutum]